MAVPAIRRQPTAELDLGPDRGATRWRLRRLGCWSCASCADYGRADFRKSRSRGTDTVERTWAMSSESTGRCSSRATSAAW